MSANPVARPQSRRGILTAALAGTAASAATFGGHVVLAATAEPDPATDLVDAACRALDLSGEAMDADFAAIQRFRQMGGRPAVDGALIHRGAEDIALELYGSVMLTRDPADDRKTFSEDFIGFLRWSPRYKYGAIPHPDMPPPNMRQTKEPLRRRRVPTRS